jgi:ATP-binding cassette, subfamily B, bacterial
MGRDPSELTGKSIDRAVVRRAATFARPFRWLLALFLVAIVVDALLALVPPLLFRSIIDDAIPAGDTRKVTMIAVIMVVVALADAGLNLLNRWCTAKVGEGLIFELRVALYDKVQRLPIAFYTHTQTGALVSRMNNDVIGAQSAVTGTLGSVVSDVVTLTTTLVAVFFIEWRLAVVALVLFPLFVVPAKRIGRKMQVISRERMDLQARMNGQMNERFNVAGAQLVKLFGDYDREVATFEHGAARVRDTGVTQAMFGRTFFIALGLLGAVGTAAVYGVGGHLVISGAMTVGTMVVLASYLNRLYTPMTGLTNARVDLMTALVSFERVFEVLDAPNPIVDKPGAVDLVSPQGRIEFDHVGFRYPAASTATLASLEAPGTTVPGSRADAQVLHDIQLMIEPGQLVALVGPSGAGKTTMAALLPRLYDVTSGAIRLDGHDVRDLTGDSLHAAVGVVSQDPHLFHESVADNLRYARPGATDDEMVAACRAARIHDVIAGLPQGYDTVVGERGYRLSGGEKQRLAIARMLLKDPAVVILDEATSHLDAENEALVQEALEVALAGRTSIVIAHRLSTIRDADLICVIEDGRIVERGAHPELLAAGGLYADLYRTLVGESAAVDAPYVAS